MYNNVHFYKKIEPWLASVIFRHVDKKHLPTVESQCNTSYAIYCKHSYIFVHFVYTITLATNKKK